MSDKFRGKYRNESARLQTWNYASDAAYFITICTKNRIHYFGKIQHAKMQFTPAGAIAHVLWNEMKNHAKNIVLGEFVVMPNHIHGILILNGNGHVGATPVIGESSIIGESPKSQRGQSIPNNVSKTPGNNGFKIREKIRFLQLLGRINRH